MAEDARIRKTKQKLSTALVELLKEQPFEDITPAVLCEKAGINRSTFYRNYKNTAQLRDEIEGKILNNVQWSGRGFDQIGSRSEILKQLSFLQEEKDIFGALSSGSFKESIFGKVNKKLIEDALKQYGKYSDRVSEAEYRQDCVFFISAIVGVIYSWYQLGMQENPEMLADFIVSKLKDGYPEYMK